MPGCRDLRTKALDYPGRQSLDSWSRMGTLQAMSTLTAVEELSLLRRFVRWADPVFQRYDEGVNGVRSMVIYDEIAWSDDRCGFTVDEMSFLEELVK